MRSKVLIAEETITSNVCSHLGSSVSSTVRDLKRRSPVALSVTVTSASAGLADLVRRFCPRRTVTEKRYCLGRGNASASLCSRTTRADSSASMRCARSSTQRLAAPMLVSLTQAAAGTTKTSTFLRSSLLSTFCTAWRPFASHAPAFPLIAPIEIEGGAVSFAALDFAGVISDWKRACTEREYSVTAIDAVWCQTNLCKPTFDRSMRKTARLYSLSGRSRTSCVELRMNSNKSVTDCENRPSPSGIH